MVDLLPSWNKVRVYGTWILPDGSAKMAGTYKVETPGRLTNSTDDAIIPAGVVLSGNLDTSDGTPSLDIMVPADDDPDIQQSGWHLKITITLTTPAGKVTETYIPTIPLANRPTDDGGNGDGVNLRNIVPDSSSITPLVAQYGVGVPGGLATLSTDGLAVLDANGNPITGGGGDGTGASSWSDLAGKPAALASLTATATASQVRSAIGAASADDLTSLATTVSAKADASTVNTALAAKVNTSTTINGHALSGNVTLTATDVGAVTASSLAPVATSGVYDDLTGKPSIPDSADDIGAVPTTRTVNGKALSADITLAAADVGAATSAQGAKADTAVQPAALSGYVPTTRTIAGHALSADVTLAKADVGLGSVDNTADTAKNVLSATKLTTARAINSVNFDGTAAITIHDPTQPYVIYWTGTAWPTPAPPAGYALGYYNYDSFSGTAYDPDATAPAAAHTGDLWRKAPAS